MHREHVYKPVIGILVTAALTALYYRLGDNPRHDEFSAGLIAVSFWAAALVILCFTERWSWRAVGVMIALAGTAVVYSIVFGRARDLLTANPLLTRSILRASLDVGGVLLVLGLFMWALERRSGQHISLFEWIDSREGGGDA